jgi:hypothetical protein
MVQLCDTLALDRSARICADGSLVAEVFAARTGLQDYRGAEVDPENKHGLRDKAIVQVYRPEAEVFKADSLATFAAAPVTVDHPSEAVTADNWRGLGVGEINGDVVRDGQRVRVPIIVRDSAAVKAATSTHKQLSMGYATELVFPKDGKHPDGTACDAYQTNLKINHIALVPAARGGPELRVVDERTAPITTKDEPMKKITLDGLQVDLSDADAVSAAFDKLQAKVATADKALADAQTEHDKAIAKLDAKVEELEGKVVDQAQIDALADAKADTVAKAKAVCGDKLPDTSGKTVGEVRRMALDAKGIDCTDKSDDYIEARFDALTADASGKVEPITPKTTTNDAASDIVAARAARNARLATAYKGA